MKKHKELLRTALKLGVGAAVVYYVMKSKMVDFQALSSVLWNPFNLMLGMFFLAFTVVCSAARWHLLVRAQGLSLSYAHLIELTMIGNFFNTFMPGAVGGDVMKAWYVAGREPQKKTRAILTVFLDRVIGLSVIIFYSASTLVFHTEWLEGQPQLKVIALSIWTFTGSSVLIGLVFFASPLWKSDVLSRLLAFFYKSKRLKTLIDATLLYRHHLRAVILAIALSAVSVLGMTLMYKLQGNALGIPMSLPQYFFVVPLALTASAIPLLPGGLGVGQVAFFTLFKWIGVPDPEQGGTLCTLIQIYTLLFNCLGAIFYLRFKRNPVSLQGTTEIPEEQPHLVRTSPTVPAT